MRHSARLLLFVALLIVSVLSAAAQSAAVPSGHWEGKIQISERAVGIMVDLARTAGGPWIGSMSVIGSSSIDVPLSDISVDGMAVRFTSYLPVKASFEGTVSADGTTVTGKASNVEGDAPFQLTRSGEANVKVPPPSSLLTKNFEGTWEGTIDVAGKVRRLALKLSAAPDGTAIGTLISVDKGGLEIPAATVTIQDNRLQLESRAVSGTYRGTLGPNGDIVGEWTEPSARIPLTFKPAAR